jgi:GT2 family glycosyltransferase
MRDVIRNSGGMIVPFRGPFNFARMMNEGAKAASGDVLVFVNDDIEPVSPDWLPNLISPLQNSDIGVTGARLVYPNGTIQHAGIVLGMSDATGHCGRFLFDSAWWPWINHTRDVSAVTGACLATTTKLFRALSGFDERFPINYNDVDYCLRARGSGFRTVIESEAVLVHHEGLSRAAGTSFSERIAFFRVWGHLLETPDPFFTPHLRTDREDLLLTQGTES